MKMSLVYYIILESLLFLSQLHLHSARKFSSQVDCVFNCGELGNLYPPFTNTTNSTCAMFLINCTKADEPKVQFSKQGKWYHIEYINLSTKTIKIRDPDLEGHLASNKCELLNNFTDQAYLLKNFTEQRPPFLSINFFNKAHPFFKCKRVRAPPLKFFTQFQRYSSCADSYDLYYYDDENRHLPFPADLPNRCTVVNLPSADSDTNWGENNLTSFWSATFIIKWKTLADCDRCSINGGRCSANANNGFECKVADREVLPECAKCSRNNGGPCLDKDNNISACKLEVLQVCSNCSKSGGPCLDKDKISKCPQKGNYELI